MGHFFYFLISFIVALFFILIGIIGMMIPWSIDVRNLLTRFIFEDSLAISLFGFSFLVIGSAIVLNVLLSLRHRHYKIDSKNVLVTVDDAVILEYLNTYWKQLFPKHEIPCLLTIKENKFHISVDFPYLPLKEQKPLLERIRKDLSSILAKALGYNEEFYLSASFQIKAPEN